MIVIGFSIFLFKRSNLLFLLIGLELLSLGMNVQLCHFSILFSDILGIIYIFMIIIAGACEISFGLVIIVLLYRLRGGILINLLRLVKGG